MFELSGSVSQSGVHTLQRLLERGVIGSAWYSETTESTNAAALDQLRERDFSSDLFPRLYLTDSQTAGRGRRGRQWISNPQNLAFSLVVTSDEFMQAREGWPSIAVGVAVAQTIEHDFAPTKTWLKWPNDVWIDGGKVAGILLEKTSSQPKQTVIGIGINIVEAPTLTLADREQSEPVKLANFVKAKSIAQTTGRQADRFSLLEALVPTLIDVLRVAPEELSSVLEQFRARCLLSGKPIHFSHRGQMVQGKCLGINEQGALLVEHQGETMTVQSGDASLVRID